MPLTGKQRQHLRALAHHLEPVVHVGHDGVTPPVLSQIEEALVAHELIKIRVSADAPATREESAEAMAAGARAEVAQIIGRIVVLWRRRPPTKKKAKISLSAKGDQKGSKGRAPSQRARAKVKTAVARSAKRRKLARANVRGRGRAGGSGGRGGGSAGSGGGGGGEDKGPRE
ncbi:MAG TPA: ribosome assembly RNA-binding protein YhbY [Polyangiaceae bacterium]|jgi:RNA-binding protein|nr:ribosome assembly RNA-binding protein YhbY [Polyangiaceae bacterium]